MIGASSTKKTPSGNSSSSLRGHLRAPAASCPTPPGPVRVSRRVAAQQARDAAPARAPGRRSGRELDGQVVGSALEGPQRRELGRQVRATMSWKMRSGRSRSLSRCSPRSRSSSPSGRLPSDQLGRRRREQHLAAVARGRDARRPMEREADVVVAAQRPLAGVQPIRTWIGASSRPGVSRQSARWAASRCRDRGRRAAEHGEDGVPLGPGDRSLPRSDRLARGGGCGLTSDRPPPRTQGLEYPGRPLDVGEQERDRAGRELSHVRSERTRPLSLGAWSRPGSDGAERHPWVDDGAAVGSARLLVGRSRRLLAKGRRQCSR